VIGPATFPWFAADRAGGVSGGAKIDQAAE
jgi:hypothetical protein